ncbi:MAG: transcription antitermination factor NusB, partial [Clostridia bacterium]
FSRPAGGAGASSAGARSYGRPAGAGAGAGASVGGERKFSRPAGGEHQFSRPAGGAGASGGARSYAKPSFAGQGGDRRPAMRAPGRSFAPRPTDRRFARPVSREPQETTGLTVSARRVALDVLTDVHQNGAFAELSLNDRLRAAQLKPEDKRLVTRIVYGTLENELRIDYALDKYMEKPTNEPSQRDILRMSACQILFFDRVPDSAAVNEAVNLIKTMGMEGASGFINAVLRSLVRGKEEFEWPKREDDLRYYLHIMGSMPLWIVDKLIAAYGEEEAEHLILQRETEHPIAVRPNMMRLTDDAFEALLQTKELRYARGVAPHAFFLYGADELTFDKDYQAGMFSIQGQSSMLAADAVQAKPGMKVLDACAAPGGKSAYLCESMQTTGRVYAWELHEKRAQLLEGVKRRLQLDNLRISVRDATDPRPDMDGTLDAVLLDAPCSGLGVMAQK